MEQHSQLTLRTYRPLPDPLPYPLCLEDYLLDSYDLRPELTACTLVKQLPGGDGQLAVGYEPGSRGPERRALLERPVRARPFSHVRLFDHAALIWEGRLIDSDLSGGTLRAFTAQGYGLAGLKDAVLLNLPQLTLSGDVALAYALLSCPTGLQPASTSAGLFQTAPTFWQLPVFEGQQAAQVVDQISKVGAKGNYLLDFWVDHERVCYLQARAVPAQPQYWVPFDDTVSWHEESADAYGTVVVRYTDTDPTTLTTATSTSTSTATSSSSGGTTTNTTVTVVESSARERTLNVTRSYTLTDPSFTPAFDGVRRTQVVQAGKMDRESAQQFAASWLALHAHAIPKVTIRRSDGRGLELFAGGAEYPTACVEVGQWLQVGDQPPLVIIGIHHDLSRGETTFELNQPFSDANGTLFDLRQIAGALVRGVSPTTGAPVTAL